MSAGEACATSAGTNGRTVGLPVQAVVWTHTGQWQEMPSRRRPRDSNRSAMSRAVLNPVSDCSM